jgi:hypothetical protein
MTAAKQSYWQEEPARLTGQVAALLALLTAAGLQLSSQTTAAITTLASGLAVLAGAYFLRTKVTSPATASRTAAQIVALSQVKFSGAGVDGYGTASAFPVSVPTDPMYLPDPPVVADGPVAPAA